MVDFVETPIQVSGQISSAGPDATRQLSNLLNDFSQAAGIERTKQVERKSLAAGFQAGLKGDLPSGVEFNVANQAFNRGLRVSFLAEADGDIRTTINRLAGEHPLDPQAFENGVFAFEEGMLKNIPDDELRAGLTQNIRQRGEAAFTTIANAKRDHDKAVSWNAINTEVMGLNIEAQEFASAGDLLESGISMVKAFNYLDQAVVAGQIDLETATKRKRLIQRDATIESIRFEVERDFKSMDSFGEALSRLEDRNKPKDFTEKEWINVKNQLETDLKNRIDRQQIDESNQDTLLKAEQDSNFNDLQIGIVTGEVTTSQITQMAANGEITGDQMVKLQNRMTSRGRGADDPLIINQINRMIIADNFAGANDLINTNWGTNLTDAKALDLYRMVANESDPDGLIGSQEAKNWKTTLRRFMGEASLLQKFEGNLARKIENATIEYNDLVAGGTDPRTAYNMILQKHKTPTEIFEGMRDPRFSTQKTDIPGTVKNLSKALKLNHISKAEYDSEISYIKNRLQPALQLSTDFDNLTQINSKQVKAAE